MGLLNKLLDDLEERQADLSGDRDKILEGLSPVREDDLRPDRRKHYVAFAVVGICLVVALAYHFLEFRDGKLVVDIQQADREPPAMDAGLTSNTKQPAAIDASSMDPAERVVFDVQLTEMGKSQAGVPLEPVSTPGPRPSASYADNADKNAEKNVVPAPSRPEKTRQAVADQPAADTSANAGSQPATRPATESATQPATEDNRSPEADVADVAGAADETSAAGVAGPTDVENADKSEGSFSRVKVTAQSLYEEGLKLNEAGNKAAAIEQMTRAVERDPGHLEARDRLAAYLLDRGRTGRAIEVLLTGLELHPGQHDWAELAAHILVERGELDAAVQTLEMRRPAVPQDPDYYAFLAALLQKLGRYEESVDHYRRVVQVRPDKGIWWMGLGISLERTEQFSDANAAYRNALKDNSLSNELRRYINQRITVVSGR